MDIVTAYFDINRENWKSFNRSFEKYFDKFSKWSKLNNNIICYVNSQEIAERIISLRKEYGLLHKTQLVVLPDYKELDIELYESIKKVSSNRIQRNFHVFPNNPESYNADYNYVMMLKFWCLKDALKRNLYTSDFVMWLDFGYSPLIEGTNFEFEWGKEKFENDKINMFSIKKITDVPIFDIVRNMDTILVGCLFSLNIMHVDWLWSNMRANMISLNKVGLMDDDQVIMLMCYREKPELFKINKSRWDDIIFEYSDAKCNCLTNVRDKDFALRTKLRKLKLFFRRVNYIIREFKYIIKYGDIG